MLKRLVRVEGGGTPSKDQGDFSSGDIPWVSPKDMKSRLIMDTLDKITRRESGKARLISYRKERS